MKQDDESYHDVQTIVAAQLGDAVSFIDTIAEERKRATEYYRGDPFGDEEDGRSKAVSRDVADTVNAMMPSIMRIFAGGDSVVEFVPQTEEDVEAAKQATDYINYIFMRDNPGFEILWAVFKDALIRKVGVVKWWWDESEETKTYDYTGITLEQAQMLIEDATKPGVTEATIEESVQGLDGLDIKVRITRRKDRLCVAALPPEEFLIDRNARDIDTAAFVAHRTMKTVSELVAMGYDEDEVEANADDGDELASTPDRLARNPLGLATGWPQSDAAVKLVLYCESYLYMDRNGDGIAELVRVCTLGSAHKVVDVEEVESRTFAAFQCDPEPHTFFGYSLADKTMDIQRLKSALLRAALDSLALSINPRVVVSSELGGASVVGDVLNTEIGAVIRSKDPSAVNYIVAPDVSGSAFEAMGYLDQVKETRTGMSRVALGLDPKALQNTSATAASGQFSQSQQHIELVARIFAETGMKRLFRGLLKMVQANQRQSRVVNLRGKWVPVDPRGWKADMDVVANVALGGGTQGEKIAILNMVAAKQELIMQTAGMDNPLAGPEQYYRTLTEMLQLAGFKNGDAFFSDPANAPPQPPPPNPEMVKAQTEQMKAQQAAQLQREQAQADFTLSQQKADADLQLQAQKNELAVNLEREKAAVQLQLKRDQAQAELELKREEMALEFELKSRMAEHDARLKQSQAESASIDGPTQGGEPG